MLLLRRLLFVGLFVLLSAILFTLLLAPVFNALLAVYSYRRPAHATPGTASSASSSKGGEALDFRPDDTDAKQNTQAPSPETTQPFGVAENFLMTSWVSITAGMSLFLAAAIFLLLGQVIRALRSRWGTAKKLLKEKHPGKGAEAAP